MTFTEDELLQLIDAVAYKAEVSKQNDRKFHDEVWGPLLTRLVDELDRVSSGRKEAKR